MFILDGQRPKVPMLQLHSQFQTIGQLQVTTSKSMEIQQLTHILDLSSTEVSSIGHRKKMMQSSIQCFNSGLGVCYGNTTEMVEVGSKQKIGCARDLNIGNFLFGAGKLRARTGTASPQPNDRSLPFPISTASLIQIIQNGCSHQGCERQDPVQPGI